MSTEVSGGLVNCAKSELLKEIIESMNERAFRAQMDREWGRIVCPEKQELQRLEEKVCSNSSLEECESTV